MRHASQGMRSRFSLTIIA